MELGLAILLFLAPIFIVFILAIGSDPLEPIYADSDKKQKEELE